MSKLEEKLSYAFSDISLLEHALVHSSFANENRGKSLTSNERLEFLGDSVLGMIVAEHLYRSFPDKPEGELTRMRASLVCESSLVEIAKVLGLGDEIRLGKGEAAGGGRHRSSILADCVEAVLAAVYLDGGFAAAKQMVDRFLLIPGDFLEMENQDYKTALQELVQREKEQVLTYQLTGESGPDHDKVFHVDVRLNGEVVGSGSGRSKKKAEQAAARHALKELFPEKARW